MRAIGELRVRAWATEIPEVVAMKCWLDEFDGGARHWAAFDGGKIIAGARMSIHSDIAEVPEAAVYTGFFHDPLPAPIASINRLVVDPSYRGKGLGTKLDLIRVDAAVSANCGCVIGETPSGERRVKQLESIGFSRAGAGPPPAFGPNLYHPSRSVVMILYCPQSRSTFDSRSDGPAPE